MKEKNFPNLFNFATSELSQDAFISWLTSWAHPDMREVNCLLHEAGDKLLREFFKKHHEEYPEHIISVDVYQQHEKIDVLIIVNNAFAVIVEDKTGTTEHSGQLERYTEAINKSGKFGSLKPLPLYFTTGDQGNYEGIREAKYKVFSRKDFLKILKEFSAKGVDNNIFSDYFSYLQDIDNRVESYRHELLQDWCWDAWKGFYLNLQKYRNDANWDYVANPSGGFLGFWWHFSKVENLQLYLQIEQEWDEKNSNGKLCFKIHVDDKERQSSMRNFWHEAIIKIGLDNELNIVKPHRFGTGACMTVAMIKGEFRQTDKDGRIDIDATIEVLRRTEKLLDLALISSSRI